MSFLLDVTSCFLSDSRLATNRYGPLALVYSGETEAALQRHEVQPACPAHDKFAVEHDVAGKPVGDRGDDLGEVSGEGVVVAGVQPHPSAVRGGDRPVG
jgi:hypothetical protein